MQDIRIPVVAESSEDWHQRGFPVEGNFGPCAPGTRSLSANESALNGHPHHQDQTDHHANAFATGDPAFETHAQYSGDSSVDMAPWFGQGSARPARRLATPYLSQGSDRSVDPRISTASPSTPTVVESPRMWDSSNPTEAVEVDSRQSVIGPKAREGLPETSTFEPF
ncbi:hypothetical protein ACEPAH_4620 [Sanghuangporus vaninii]